MMERVNLIPDDVAVTWKDRTLVFVDRHFLQVLACVVGITCLLEGGAALREELLIRRYTKQASSVDAKRSALITELEKAKAYMAQLDQTDAQLKQQAQWLVQRIKYLGAYREQQGEWSSMLGEIKRSIPYGVWLTEFEGGGEGRLRIVGGAFEDRLVTQFMGQLKENPRFTNVAFSYTRKAKIGKTNIIAFEVTCQTVAPGAAAS